MPFITYPPATTLDPADLLLVKNSGATKRATLGQARAVAWVNVKDYGAVGDGVADDTAAINAAVAAAPSGSTMYIPPGVFKITATIDTGNKMLNWLSARSATTAFPLTGYGSFITGDVAGPLIRTIGPAASGGTGPTFDGLSLVNTHASGGCLWVEAAVYTVFRDCGINCQGIGIYCVENTGGTLDSCVFTSSHPAGSVAMLLHGLGFSILSADVTAFETGLQLAGVGCRFIGGRFENNKVGIKLGVDENGADFQSGGVFLGLGFEANDTAIEVHQAAGVVLSCGVQGSAIAPSGLSAYGLNVVGNMQDSVVGPCLFNGDYANAGVKVRNAQVRLAFRNTEATASTGVGWDLSGIGDTSFAQCNNPGGGQQIQWAAAAPVSGAWHVGDVVYNTAPAASGTIGWVCTGAGTPGTWKTWGAISA